MPPAGFILPGMETARWGSLRRAVTLSGPLVAVVPCGRRFHGHPTSRDGEATSGGKASALGDEDSAPVSVPRGGKTGTGPPRTAGEPPDDPGDQGPAGATGAAGAPPCSFKDCPSPIVSGKSDFGMPWADS